MVDVVKRGRGRPRKNAEAPVSVKPKRGRGRPFFEPKPSDYRKVEEMVSGGMSIDAIAVAVGITKPTLYKHFAEELSQGAAKKRGELIDMLFKAARKGNVTAIKRLIDINEVALAQEQMVARGNGPGGTGGAPAVAEEPTAKPVKLGKKEARQQIADAVEGLYAPPAPPKLVVNNRT